jgi:uncharacterized protein
VTVDALEQRDAEALGFEAARAVEGLLQADVALDFLARERSKRDPRDIDVCLEEARRRAADAACGQELRARAAQVCELSTRARRLTWLIENGIPAGCDLIASDDDGLGMARGYGIGLCTRKPNGARLGVLVRPRGLIDAWTDRLEGQTQTLEQHAPIDRGRCENQRRAGGHCSPTRNKGLGVPHRFDLEGTDTYHTRPMSVGWSKLHDIDPWADARTELDFSIPLKEFPRLAPQLADTAGDARGSVRFERRDGIAVADVSVGATMHLLCQRCLAPLEQVVHSRGRVAMVEEGSEAERVPAELETILAPGRRLSVVDLVEEELLLCLPVVPLHEASQCVTGAPAVASTPHTGQQDRQRPFEQLGELFKRGD